jgi:hypothetical protein
MSTEESKRRAQKACLEILQLCPIPIDDYRYPPPDVMGFLADRNIRKDDLLHIAEHVAQHWPQVVAVRCGISSNRPYFSIHLTPFSPTAQREHWPLGDWIESTLQTTDCDFIFLPPMTESTYSPRINIYEIANKSQTRSFPDAA